MDWTAAGNAPHASWRSAMRLMRAMSSEGSNGFGTKSSAPSLMAATTVATSTRREITRIGAGYCLAGKSRRRSIPERPRRLMSRRIQTGTRLRAVANNPELSAKQTHSNPASCNALCKTSRTSNSLSRTKTTPREPAFSARCLIPSRLSLLFILTRSLRDAGHLDLKARRRHYVSVSRPPLISVEEVRLGRNNPIPHRLEAEIASLMSSDLRSCKLRNVVRD